MFVRNVFETIFVQTITNPKNNSTVVSLKNTLYKKKGEYKSKTISVGVIKYVLLGRFIRDVNWLVEPCVIGFCLIITFITVSDVLQRSQHRDCY